MIISSVNSNQAFSQILAATDANTALARSNKLLSAQQQNKLKAAEEAKITEQVDKIKATYDTAWQLDLAKIHYEQQQAVINAYVQSSNNDNSNAQSSSSAVKTLTEMYAAIYQAHEKIKEIEDENNKTPSVLPIEVNSSSAQSSSSAQLNAYNSIMMPNQSSYLHLRA